MATEAQVHGDLCLTSKCEIRGHMNNIEIDEQERFDSFHKNSNKRKREIYWIGFLEGTLSSKGIESGEKEALHAEAQRFQKFFNDPDASDLEADLKARCHSSTQDLMDQISSIIQEKRRELCIELQYSQNDEMSEFLGFCAGIICDGRVFQAEAEAILFRFRRSVALTEGVPFHNLSKAIEAALTD
jgi:hypothetical protein